MLPYLTLIRYGIPFVIGAILFGGSAWKIQGIRVDRLKGEVSICKEANLTNVQTIDTLKADIAKQDKTCQARLASKDSTINNLRSIDDLKGKKDDKGKVTSDDPILNHLNGMFSNK